MREHMDGAPVARLKNRDIGGGQLDAAEGDRALFEDKDARFVFHHERTGEIQKCERFRAVAIAARRNMIAVAFHGAAG